jgi:hypothetical protein
MQGMLRVEPYLSSWLELLMASSISTFGARPGICPPVNLRFTSGCFGAIADPPVGAIHV